MPAVVMISGSPATRSRTDGLAENVVRRCQALGHRVEHLRVRELPPAALLAGNRSVPAIARALRAVEIAEGIVLATPIYQASYSGLLKTFLDVVPQFGFAGKVVLPLATGGSPAHVLALDYGLRPVIQSFAPRQVMQSLFVLGQRIFVTDEGAVLDEEPAAVLDGLVHDFHLSLCETARPVTIPRSA
jgi:FMN reductase